MKRILTLGGVLILGVAVTAGCHDPGGAQRVGHTRGLDVDHDFDQHGRGHAHAHAVGRSAGHFCDGRLPSGAARFSLCRVARPTHRMRG